MDGAGFSIEKGHPIKVVSLRTGLTPDVIRVWERRYRAVSPERSPTNRRVYTDEDVERLLLLKRAISSGRRIGDIASLPTLRLRSLVAEDAAATVPRDPSPARPSRARAADAGACLARCLESVTDLDAARLERELAAGAVGLSVPELLQDVLCPLLHHVGNGWRDGMLRVSHEHLVTAVVRPFLASMRHDPDDDGRAPDLVVATPAGQAHELGAMMAAVTASREGWRVTYLGANLPAEDIVATANTRGSRAVALSVVYPSDDPRLSDELRRLRRLLPAELRLIVGGAAVPGYRAVLDEIGAAVAGDLKALRRELETLRYGRA